MRNGHEEARVLLTVGQLAEPLTGRTWDAPAVTREVSARAARHRRRGLRPGDRVLLHFGNRLEFFAELLALWRAGAVAVPVDATLTRVELERLVETVAPRFSVVDDATAGAIARALPPGTDGARRDRDARARGSACRSAGGRGAPGRRRARALHLRIERRAQGRGAHPRLAGRPLGRAAARARARRLRPHALPAADPLRTRAHLQQPLPVARRPGRSSSRRPSGPISCSASARSSTSIGSRFLSSVPAMWRLALRVARPPREGTLQRVHCGSAPLPATLWESVRGWAGTPDVFNTYGLTETGSWVAGTSDGPFTPADGLIGPPWGAILHVQGADAAPCAPRRGRARCGSRARPSCAAISARTSSRGGRSATAASPPGTWACSTSAAGSISAGASATRSTRAVSRSPPPRWTRPPRAAGASPTSARSRWTIPSTARTWASRWPSPSPATRRCARSTAGSASGSPRASCPRGGGWWTRSRGPSAAR